MEAWNSVYKLIILIHFDYSRSIIVIETLTCMYEGLGFNCLALNYVAFAQFKIFS